MTAPQVLISDAQPRMTLAVVRSLGKKGLKVWAAEKTRFAPALFSRYCSRALLSPDPGTHPEDYYQWLVNILTHHPFEVFIPVDDATLEVVMSHRVELDSLTRMALPPVESYRIAVDKGLTVQAAYEAGLTCPPTIFPNNKEDALAQADKLQYPLVIKPRKSSGARGITFVNSKEELAEKYQSVQARYLNLIIQEYIPPVAKYSVCLLFDRRSRLKASFVQKQIRHYPEDIGTSVVQEGVYFPELVGQALLLMEKLPWFGVAELEFLIDKEGHSFFLEINPRFWGSLYNAILAGVDFPWLLYLLARDKEVAGIFDYRTGLRCRWLLPGDILHFLTVKNRSAMDPPFLAGQRQQVYDDILSREDPLPVLGFILACGRYLFDANMWKFLLKR